MRIARSFRARHISGVNKAKFEYLLEELEDVMRLKSVGLFSGAILLSATIIGAQQSPISSGETVAPSFVGVSSSDVGGRRLMKFSGILRDPSGRPLSGVGGLTFAIYRDHEGGAPLWQESQNVQVDAQGNFSVLLGSTTDGGFPLDILSPDEPRWLGVRTQLPQGEEQARLLLVSVPYALKAADADTLGGKPASAYLLAPPEGPDSRSLERTSGSRSAKPSESSKLKTADAPASFAVSGTGSVDRVTKWSDTSGTLVDSSITDTSGKVGIGTANPLVNFDTKIGTDQHVGIQTISSTPTVIYLNDANSYTTGRIEASALSINAASGGNVGIGTANPLVNFDTKVGTNQHVGIQTISSTPTVIYLNDASSYMTGRIEASALSINTASGGKVGIGTANPLVNFDTKVGINQHVGIQTISSTPTLIYLNDSNSYTTGRIEASALLLNAASGGNVGIGTTNPTTRLHVVGNATVNGDITVDGNIAAKYQDVAEWVEGSGALEPGTVVVIDEEHRGHIRASDSSYDTTVVGAVSPQPGLILGESGPNKVMVSQSGRVRVKVDASYGTIRAGDLLVTSPTPGHAMRSEPVMIGGIAMHRPGTLLGKALQPLSEGRGEVLVLLTLQ
jgi:hypothetical protein